MVHLGEKGLRCVTFKCGKIEEEIETKRKRSITRQNGVSEATIRKIWSNREDIRKCSDLMSEEAKKKTFRASVGRFTEVEDKLYL